MSTDGTGKSFEDRLTGEPREFTLAHSRGGRKVHLVPTDRIPSNAIEDHHGTDKHGSIQAECHATSVWTPAASQARSKYDPSVLCFECFRIAYARKHIQTPRPFTADDLSRTG